MVAVWYTDFAKFFFSDKLSRIAREVVTQLANWHLKATAVDDKSDAHGQCALIDTDEIVSLITFRVSRRRREMYCGNVVTRVCVCVCVCLSAAACPRYRTDPDVTWGSGRGCLLVVHYWADFQSVDASNRLSTTRTSK